MREWEKVHGVRTLLQSIVLCTGLSYDFVYQDLHERIDKTRFTDPLEDSGFQYGFNSTYLKKVVSYWRNTFDWKKQVAMLNKYLHFKTKIEGTHRYRMNSSWLNFLSGKICFMSFVVVQDWTCTSSMCAHYRGGTRGLCRSCLFTAGLAPSMSSTRFFHFSHRTTTDLRLRL